MLHTNVGPLAGGPAEPQFIINKNMKNIKEESGRNLLNWFDREVRIDHYDPVETPARAPYSLADLRNELLRRLMNFDCSDNR